MVSPRSALVLGLVSSAALVGVLAGPRVRVDLPEHGTPPLEDLDAYLAEAEAHHGDLRPGTEKTIVWHDPLLRSPTPVSVVYLHGFSATRQETAPLAELIASRLEANLFYTRLAGHGRPGDAMGEATAGDWLADALEAFAIGQQLGDRVVVIGTSTGGTLALWLAGQTLEDPSIARSLEAVVLISPNLGPADSRSEMLLWPWGRRLAHAVQGSHYEWEPANEDHARYWSLRYPTDALVEMMALVASVRDLPLQEIRVPALIFFSPDDQVVDASKIELHADRLGATPKKLIPVTDTGDPSRHVLAGSVLSPQTTERMARESVDFLRSLH